MKLELVPVIFFCLVCLKYVFFDHSFLKDLNEFVYQNPKFLRFRILLCQTELVCYGLIALVLLLDSAIKLF